MTIKELEKHCAGLEKTLDKELRKIDSLYKKMNKLNNNAHGARLTIEELFLQLDEARTLDKIKKKSDNKVRPKASAPKKTRRSK